MKNLLLAGILCLSISSAFCQTFSYSFSGSISNENQSEIISEVLRIPEILEAKINYKEEKSSGEIIFRFKEIKSEEPTNSFYQSKLKAILLNNRLTPNKLIQLKD